MLYGSTSFKHRENVILSHLSLVQSVTFKEECLYIFLCFIFFATHPLLDLALDSYWVILARENAASPQDADATTMLNSGEGVIQCDLQGFSTQHFASLSLHVL